MAKPQTFKAPEIKSETLTVEIPKWEYLTEDVSKVDGITLKEFGDKGWEMCGVVAHGSYGATLYFKRPIL